MVIRNVRQPEPPARGKTSRRPLGKAASAVRAASQENVVWGTKPVPDAAHVMQMSFAAGAGAIQIEGER